VGIGQLNRPQAKAVSWTVNGVGCGIEIHGTKLFTISSTVAGICARLGASDTDPIKTNWILAVPVTLDLLASHLSLLSTAIAPVLLTFFLLLEAPLLRPFVSVVSHTPIDFVSVLFLTLFMRNSSSFPISVDMRINVCVSYHRSSPCGELCGKYVSRQHIASQSR
jgi:hypothetical protein